MLENKGKITLSFMGLMSCFLMAHADQSMNGSQMQNDSAETPQAYVPGEIIKAGQLPAGYNASATYQCAGGLDVFISADYIYWAWEQDSLQLGSFIPNTVATPNLAGSIGNIEDVFQDPGYASGFQVGLGVSMPGMDDWNLYAEYTWYKNTDTSSVSTGSRVFRLSEVVHRDNPVLETLKGTVSSTVKMKFDALDVLLKRPFYFGKKLTANFGAGLSALWITQTFDHAMTGLAGPVLNVPINRVNNTTQTSWALGPKLGLETNWMLGFGLQIMANLSTSVLYARYNLNNEGSATISGVSTSFSGETLHNVGTLRPITEAFLGLGWNRGFCDDSFRFALSAGYDFNVYWDYNMQGSVGANPGNMYLQGLNIQARFDF